MHPVYSLSTDIRPSQDHRILRMQTVRINLAQVVFGRVDAIRRRIDEALENDDMHRRRRDMRVLPLPKNFPQPQSMGQSPVPTWIRWIREESEQIVGDLEEEIKRQKDPDDPFDGMASGIFEPLEHDTRAPLIPLPEEKKPIQHK